MSPKTCFYFEKHANVPCWQLTSTGNISLLSFFFSSLAFHKLVRQKCYRSLSCEFLQPPSHSATPCAVSITGWSWLSWLSCCTCFKHARTLHSLSCLFPFPWMCARPGWERKEKKKEGGPIARNHRCLLPITGVSPPSPSLSLPPFFF